MFKLIKRVVIFGGLAAVLLIGGIVYFVMSGMNEGVRLATEKALAYVLQVDVTLEGVKVRPFRGTASLEGLVIGNSDGFKTDSALAFDRIDVEVDLQSFMTDQPVINLISIKSPKITLEQGLRKSNLGELLKNASRFDKGGGEADAEAPEGAKKKIRIEKIVLEDSTVALSAPLLQGAEVSYTLPTFEINDLGGEGKFVSVGKALQVFLGKVLSESVKSASGVASSDLLGNLDETLSESLSGLGGLQESVGEIGGGVGEKLKGVTEGVKGLLKKNED